MCLAVPGQIREIYEAHGLRMGRVDFGGVVKEVCLACVPEVAIGDYALVHAGLAISRLDEQSALDTLRLFSEIGVLHGEHDAPDRAAHDEATGAGSSRPADTRGQDEVRR